MLANQVGEVISRFIGSFNLTTELDRARSENEAFRASKEDTSLDHGTGRSEDFRPEAISSSAFNPKIDMPLSDFAIENVKGMRLAPGSPVETAVPAQFQDPFFFRDWLSGRFPGGSGEPVYVSRADYGDGPTSTVSTIGQDLAIYDDDVFSMVPDREPLSIVEGVAAELNTMIEAAREWQSLPEVQAEASALKALLQTPSFHDAQDGEGPVNPPDHQGVFINGEAADEMPDLTALLEEMFPVLGGERDALPDSPNGNAVSFEPSGASASLHTGGNLLVNQTLMVEAYASGYTTVVLGDYFETNVIRQLNIHVDRDEVTDSSGHTSITTQFAQTYNVASFERVDALVERDGPVVPRFPQYYQVDVVQGDLIVSSMVRQVHTVIDQDRALLTSIEHSAEIRMGDNTTLSFATIAELSILYDIVIFGGNVYEGNFIEQINILLDNDRVDVGPHGAETSTGGNLLYNQASIVNYGSNEGFLAVSPAFRELIDHFDARDGVIGNDTAEALAYLGLSGLRVLYVTGDYYEINVVSQINILADADSASFANDLMAQVVDGAPASAQWTLTTGGNALVNAATIIDVDSAGGGRHLGGNYYSDSILIQADLISNGHGIEVFDTTKLVNEVVAFTVSGDMDAQTDSGHHVPVAPAYDAPGDGVAGILV